MNSPAVTARSGASAAKQSGWTGNSRAFQKAVYEYVFVHELCHLEHRVHSPGFWSPVTRVLPDCQERKEWIEAHEVALG